MKIDAMTAGAVGFAAFAAWYVLKKPAAKSSTTGGQVAINTATDQRRQVGDALSQNTKGLYDLFGYESWQTPTNMGGAQGLHL